MTVPSPSRRRVGVLLIWCGSGAMVLAGVFALAWVKLPEWKPHWVIEHSPWADPAVRAMLHYGVKEYAYPHDYVVEWGAAIGPVLRRRYETGTPEVREQVLILAASTLDPYDDAHVIRSRQDDRRLPPGEVEALCVDLRWLAAAASREASADLRDRSLPLIVALRDPDLMHLPCDWLIAGTSGVAFHPLIEAIHDLRDPRSVPRLIPLLCTREPVEREMVAHALRKCLDRSQVAEVAEAARHQDRHVREWAASAIDLVRPDPTLEERLRGLLSDAEADVRRMALGTVIRRGLPSAFHDQVIALLRDRTHEIRRMALQAIVDEGVPAGVRTAFLECLTDPATDLRLLVIEGIGRWRIREGGAPLLALLTVEPQLSLRISAIEALGRVEQVDVRPVLRQIAQRPGDEMRGAAIVTLGRQRDPQDFPLLLTLLADEGDDIARKARIALGYLPLTAEQQKQVDTLWEAHENQ